MSISDFLENELLDHVFNNAAYTSPTNTYISLHDGDPGETGANEISAGGNTYARQEASFAAASGGSVATDAQEEWTDMPDCESGGTNEQLSHVGIWDTVSAGNFLWGGALTTPKNINAGDTFRIASGGAHGKSFMRASIAVALLGFAAAGALIGVGTLTATGENASDQTGEAHLTGVGVLVAFGIVISGYVYRPGGPGPPPPNLTTLHDIWKALVDERDGS
jgi:hypothetical protein